jgi:hypothetical protein
MLLKVSKKTGENQKNVQASEEVNSINATEIAGKCAGCGESNPEYVLEDKQLCFDCYKAEKYYWAKGSAQVNYP